MSESMGTEDVAELAGVSLATLKRWLHLGYLEFDQVGSGKRRQLTERDALAVAFMVEIAGGEISQETCGKIAWAAAHDCFQDSYHKKNFAVGINKDGELVFEYFREEDYPRVHKLFCSAGILSFRVLCLEPIIRKVVSRFRPGHEFSGWEWDEGEGDAPK